MVGRYYKHHQTGKPPPAIAIEPIDAIANYHRELRHWYVDIRIIEFGY